MFALVNTMNRLDNSPGMIESQHRTIAGAVRANAAAQRAVKRYNGSSSYMPTIIVELVRKPRGRRLWDDEYKAVEDNDLWQAEQEIEEAR